MVTRKPTPPDAGADTFASASSGPPTANPYSAASASHTPAPGSRHARFWRIAAGLLGGLVLAVVLLAAGVWVWSGRSTSLATTLAQAARYLPSDQKLETRDVSGSLRGGGSIGWLRWSNPTLAVEVDGARFGWSLAPLQQRSVKVGEVHADKVRIASTPDPDATPPEPLQQLVLPVSIDLPFQIDLIEWAGPPLVEARALSGRYRYDRVQHTLKVDGVDLAQGHYSLDATLQALAPMALQATLDGQVRTDTPGSDQPLELSAHAEVKGTLATEAARLQVLAQLRPPGMNAADALGEQKLVQAVTEAVTGKSAAKAPAKPAASNGSALAEAPANTMQADVRADVAPWAPQPLVKASADLRALNLAALWPQAPATALEGSVQAGPQDSGWQVAAQLRNDLPGPWDQGRLPVSALDAQAEYDGAQWRIPQAEVRAGDGSITAQGVYTVATSAVEGSAEVQALNPAALHTQLDAAPVNGQLRAQMEDGAVRFNADLRATGSAAPVRAKAGSKTASAPLRIQSVRANGRWDAPLLTLQQLDVDALQAQLRGQKIEVTLGDALAVRGNVALTVPGATARTNGQLGQANGEGELQLNVASAERVQAWLQSLPGLSTALKGTSVQGQARLDARWRGGLRSLQQQLNSANGTGPAAPAPVRGDTPFTLQATLTAPSMDIALPPPKDSVATTRIQLSRLNAELSGSLAKATLALDGQAKLNGQRATLNTQISGGLDTSGAAAQWRATVAALQVQLQDAARPGTWAVRLQEPLAVTVRQPAKDKAGSTVVETGAGQARVSGPVPGTVAVNWQPLRLVQSPQGAVQLQTQGELTGLPMAWVDALTAPGEESPLAAMGVAGNLVFNGRWDVDAGDTLRASAVLERASGDLRLLTGDDTAVVTTVRSSGSQPKAATSSSPSAPESGTAAGVRQARLELNAEGSQVRARLQWDSERAGQAEANASSTLTRQDGGWTWSPDTPLNARLRARLPDVGVWSALAPPGWRIHGTLDADATLSGSLNAPQWQGTLGADRITVQSLLDGVDLKDGRLRAVLRGNQLDITELSLQGGQGSQARIAGYSGNLTAPPQDGGSLQGSGTLRWGIGGAGGADASAASGSGIALDFTARLRALQVLVRADRQASVSGTLRAGLKDGQITLRGDLTVDRATIILPEASAPKLGNDVVVRSAAIDKANAAKAQKAGKSAARAQTTKVPDIAVTLNLGRDFALQGFGITTRLEGELQVRGSSVASAPPRITGEVRTVQGRYRAWGQALDVETGIARFNGPYNNPSLDILAIRPNIAVRAGVKVTGSAQTPRVRLYSDPVLPDAEILSWVVVGRSTAGGGAEAALLQQAALALLGGQGGGTGSIAQRLGVDEIGFKGPGNGNGEDASGAAITLGKRLSSNLYVTYEQSLSGAMGAIYIFYDLTKRLTLRGQTGSQSAVDIIYTVDKD